MKTWKVYVQIDAPWDSFFLIEEVPVTEEQHQQIQQAIRDNIALRNCGFSRELEELAAEAAFQHLDRYLIDLPNPEDYDTEAEYRDDINNYETTLGACKDGEFVIGNMNLDDPGDYQRLLATFVGRTYPNCAWGDAAKTFHILDTDRSMNNVVTVHFDENGIITGLDEIRVEDWAHEGLRDSDTYGYYPDYDLIEYALSQALEQYNWDNCKKYES